MSKYIPPLANNVQFSIVGSDSSPPQGRNITFVQESDSLNLTFEGAYTIPNGGAANLTFSDGLVQSIVQGSGSASIDAIIASGTGGVEFFASAAATIGSLTLTANAFVFVVGQSSNTLGSISSSAQGYLTILGSSNANLASIQVVAPVYVFVQGSGNVSIQSLLAAGNGVFTQAVDGVGAATLPKPVLQAAGNVLEITYGEGAATIGTLVAYGTNTVEFVALGNATLGSIVSTPTSTGLVFGPATSYSVIGKLAAAGMGDVQVSGPGSSSFSGFSVIGLGFAQVVGYGQSRLGEIRSFSQKGDLKEDIFEGGAYEISTLREPTPKAYSKDYLGAVYINDTRFDVLDERLKSAALKLDFQYLEEMYQTTHINVWAIKDDGTQNLIKGLNDPFEHYKFYDSVYLIELQVVTLRENRVVMEVGFKDRTTGMIDAYQIPVNFDFADHPFINLAEEISCSYKTRLNETKYETTIFERSYLSEIDSSNNVIVGSFRKTYWSTEFFRIDLINLENFSGSFRSGRFLNKYETDDLGRIQIGG